MGEYGRGKWERFEFIPESGEPVIIPGVQSVVIDLGHFGSLVKVRTSVVDERPLAIGARGDVRARYACQDRGPLRMSSVFTMRDAVVSGRDTRADGTILTLESYPGERGEPSHCFTPASLDGIGRPAVTLSGDRFICHCSCGHDTIVPAEDESRRLACEACGSEVGDAVRKSRSWRDRPPLL